MSPWFLHNLNRVVRPRLNWEDEASFVHALEELQRERGGSRVTWKEIQKLLQKHYHVTYSQNRVYAWLKWLKLRQDSLSNLAFKDYDDIVEKSCTA